MNIDERLEALTMNLELLSHASEALRDGQRQANEAHDRRMERLTASIEKLVEVTNEDGTNIRALAGIVESHERRISDIERTN